MLSNEEIGSYQKLSGAIGRPLINSEFGYRSLLMKPLSKIDRATNTDLWRKAINKEMSRVKVAWKTHNANTPQEVWNGKVPELTGF